jgi:hypothetical protein
MTAAAWRIPASAVGVLVAAMALAGSPADGPAAPPAVPASPPAGATRTCPNCKEPISVAKAKFCPACGAPLTPPAPADPNPPAPQPKADPKPAPNPERPPAPAPAPVPPPAAPKGDGEWQLKGLTYTNKPLGFSLTAPSDKWLLIAEPEQVAKLRADAALAFAHGDGRILGFVIAQNLPDELLETYAKKVEPVITPIKNEVDSRDAPAGGIGGEKAIRREFVGKRGGAFSRYFQAVVARGAMKYQIVLGGPAEAFTEEVRAEVFKLQDGLSFVGAVIPANPPVEEGAAFTVAGDTYRRRDPGFALTRPSADWKFLTQPDELKDLPAGAMVALTRADGGLTAVVLAVRSEDDLDKYARAAAPALSGRRSEPPAKAEVDGRRALKVEHRGVFEDTLWVFHQLLVADNPLRYQVVVWGPAETIDKHKAEIAALQDSFRLIEAK